MRIKDQTLNFCVFQIFGNVSGHRFTHMLSRSHHTFWPLNHLHVLWLCQSFFDDIDDPMGTDRIGRHTRHHWHTQAL